MAEIQEKLDFAYEDGMPSQEDFDNLVTHMNYFKALYKDYTDNPDKYAKGTAGYKIAWMHMPWNIAYRIKLSANQAKLARYIAATMIIGWDELLEQFKRTAKNMHLTKTDLQGIFDNIWEKHADDLGKMAEAALDNSANAYDPTVWDKITAKSKVKTTEGITEDTKKVKDHKWVNKGDDGSHGTFTTKKAADAQRKAMFANGYHEDLNDEDPTEHILYSIYDNSNNCSIKKANGVKIVFTSRTAAEKWAGAHGITDYTIKMFNPNNPFYSGKKIKFNIEESMNITEDIEKHDTLNPKLWEDNDTLKPEVEQKINELVNDFIGYLQEDNIKIIVKDIVLIGSNASYNYNENSDLDVHIITDTEAFDCPDNLYPAIYSAYRSLYNKKFDIDFYGIPVELYVETEDTPTVSNGIYSVKNKKWIKEPVAEDIPEIDMNEFNNKYTDWEEKCNNALADEKATIAKIDNLIEAIYDLRKNGLNTDGEYSIGNLVFKELRNNEFLDKLKDKKNEIRANELSLESLQEDTYGRYLTMKEIYEYREKIQRITRYQPIVQENKMFNIYNVKESDIRGIMARLRNEDFIDYVSETAGKFDFSHPKFSGMADRYYNIYGRIK